MVVPAQWGGGKLLSLGFPCPPFIRCLYRNGDNDDGERDPEVDRLSAGLASTTIVDEPDVERDAAHSEVARSFYFSVPDQESTRQSNASSQQPPTSSGNLNVRARHNPVRNCD